MPETILIHHLVEGARVAAQRDAIARVLFDGREPGGDDLVFDISPAGCVCYVDLGRAWQMSTSDDEMGEGKALDAARGFLDRARAKLTDTDAQIIASDLRPVTTEPVFATDRDAIDHWLCQFAVYVPSGTRLPSESSGVDGVASPAIGSIASPGSPPSPRSPPSQAGPTAPSLPSASDDASMVMNATVEVRIDREGKVIGLATCWRPIARTEAVERIAPAGSSDTLIYWLDEGDEGQTAVAPYYAVEAEMFLAKGVRAASRGSPVTPIAEDVYWPGRGDDG